MSNSSANIIAICLLIFVAAAAVFSIKDDSLTMDELAHLPAGYSYLTQRDMRLNPEHPPLVKDLSAIPLLFVKDIKFPSEIKEWKDDVNGQWVFGNYFLFKTGNPADQMIFWARIPMIFILIVLGFYVFRFGKEFFGNKTAVLSLLLFSLSPTLLAHGRYVTTDVGAAAGAFIATYYFLRFLKRRGEWNLFMAGIALGVAQCLKFSLILLFPFFGLLIFLWVVANSSNFGDFIKKFFRHVGYYILIVILCFIVIGCLYQYHVWGYPPERQAADTSFNLSSFGNRFLADSVIWMADKPVLRSFSQYFHGVLMILQRATGGNTTYFMNEVSASGWKIYFPFVYLIKEPLAFHILTLIAICYIIWLALKSPLWRNSFRGFLDWLKRYFAQISFIIFIAVYWATSLSSNLNIGARHLLPVFPFTILLVSGATIGWLKPPYAKIKRIFLIWLLLWQAFTVVAIYPHLLAYFNEIVGRPENGYQYTVDSNLDWGQDLKRLVQWTDEKGIAQIYVDYFGGSDTRYYLKEKFMPWWGDRDPKELPKGSYLAVSATFLQGGRGKPVAGFDQKHGYYLWLDKYEPIEKIGNSIFIYYID